MSARAALPMRGVARGDAGVVSDPSEADLAQALSAAYRARVNAETVRRVEGPDFKEAVADATLKFTAPLPDGGRGFVLMAGRGNPDLMDRAVASIVAVRANTDWRTGSAVLAPEHAGRCRGRSYAIWRRLRPFDDMGRIPRKLHQMARRSAVLAWSEDLTAQTRGLAHPDRVAADLARVADDPKFPDGMRFAARRAQGRLDRGWRPVHATQHGDFWTGNLLIGGEGPQPFSVIDWAGMRTDAYPFYDLVRMTRSMGMGSEARAKALESLRRRIGCGAADVPGYLLAGLGMIGRDLEHFPVDRYRAMAVAAFAAVDGYAC